MFNLTEKSKDFLLNIGYLFTNDNNSDTDIGLKSYCKAEYGDEWYYAYNTYKTDGRFPTDSNKR
tara:strand:- start:379 stop:570 length:192 start_codon:yes stop_codon:yes gene_type:complete